MTNVNSNAHTDDCCEGTRPLKFSRRYFLKQSGIAMVGLSAMPAFLQRAVAATPTTTGKKQFVVLFQRGAADGLNIVVPFSEPNYYRLRPTIAIPQPRRGGADAAIDLDGYFGLHPSLAPLEPLFHKNQLAIVHAAGSPDPTRSHFDAQDFMESGTPGHQSHRRRLAQSRRHLRPRRKRLALPRRRHGPKSPADAARHRFGHCSPRSQTI